MTLLTYPEAAEVLRISPLTLRKKVSQGMVPHGRVLFLRSDLERMIQSSRIEPQPAVAHG